MHLFALFVNLKHDDMIAHYNKLIGMFLCAM